MLWSVAVLYLTMGFRQFSHFFTEIQQALEQATSRPPATGSGMARRSRPPNSAPGRLARVAIEQGLLASHRHVFGTIAWFVALGPAGAILYRASAVLSELWGARSEPDFGAFGRFAARAHFWLDWVPVRLTAATFAVVGNFEDAVYCWRTQAAAWIPQAHGIILAAGGGALGVRLGDTLHQYGGLQYRPAARHRRGGGRGPWTAGCRTHLALAGAVDVPGAAGHHRTLPRLSAPAAPAERLPSQAGGESNHDSRLTLFLSPITPR